MPGMTAATLAQIAPDVSWGRGGGALTDRTRNIRCILCMFVSALHDRTFAFLVHTLPCFDYMSRTFGIEVCGGGLGHRCIEFKIQIIPECADGAVVSLW